MKAEEMMALVISALNDNGDINLGNIDEAGGHVQLEISGPDGTKFFLTISEV